MNYIRLCIGAYIYLCVHIQRMDCKKALKSGIIAVTLLVAAILATQLQQVQASDNNDNDNNNNANDNSGKNPISDALRWGAGGLEEYSAGSQAGREAAQNDFYEGTSSGAGCPGEAGNWCAGYNVGYNNVMNDLRSALR